MMALVILKDLQGRKWSGGDRNKSGAVGGTTLHKVCFTRGLCERQGEMADGARKKYRYAGTEGCIARVLLSEAQKGSFACALFLQWKSAKQQLDRDSLKSN
jgi:hypothetical protein